MESPSRRSAIPVSTTPTRLRINRTLSKSNDGNLNGPPPLNDLEMFTMLEENIALKEDKESLTRKNNDRKLYIQGIVIYFASSWFPLPISASKKYTNRKGKQQND